MIALLIPLLLGAQEQKPVRQESTWYYSNGYSPSWQLANRPWQGIAVDSAGRVVVVHGQAVAAGNKPISATQIRIFSPVGEEIAQYSTPHGFLTAGVAIDERHSRIYVASDFHHVRVVDWRGDSVSPAKDKDGGMLSVARKDGGRCAGVSLGRDGTIFTADLGENRIYRFYPPGGHSSFGSGPGSGDQGFNNVRRVFESPKNGNLYVLDFDSIRVFGSTGQFLKRLAGRGVLAMGPDGKLLLGTGETLSVTDGEGTVLRRLAIRADQVLDAALGEDGKVYVIPRGEELCCAAYDAEGKLLWRRGADFDRLAVTLRSAVVEPGRALPATVEFANALKLGLLTEAERKVAEGRPQNPSVHAFVRAGSSTAWTKLNERFVLPPDVQGSCKVRFTTTPSPGEPGPAVEMTLTAGRPGN